MMMKVSTACAALLTAAPLFAGDAEASMMDLFECGGDELSILVTLDPSTPDKAIIQYDGGEMINASILESGDKLYYELQKVPSAAGQSFAGYGKMFMARDTSATLQDKGSSSTCKLVGGEQDKSATGDGQNHDSGALGGNEVTLNAAGRSLGGKLRDGPGLNFRQVGSIREGTWMTLITNTGIIMDGYPWFEISLDDGTRGYQWGGIICSNGQFLDGAFEQCR